MKYDGYEVKQMIVSGGARSRYQFHGYRWEPCFILYAHPDHAGYNLIWCYVETTDGRILRVTEVNIRKTREV